MKDGRAGGERHYLSNWRERRNFGGQGLGFYKTALQRAEPPEQRAHGSNGEIGRNFGGVGAHDEF